jgi:hypothetical protein
VGRVFVPGVPQPHILRRLGVVQPEIGRRRSMFPWSSQRGSGYSRVGRTSNRQSPHPPSIRPLEGVLSSFACRPCDSCPTCFDESSLFFENDRPFVRAESVVRVPSPGQGESSEAFRQCQPTRGSQPRAGCHSTALLRRIRAPGADSQGSLIYRPTMSC